jgi:hypothetical protein
VLKAAAHLQPDVPVRLAQPLPQWQTDLMRRRLEVAQQQLNIQAMRGGSQQQQQSLLPRRAPRQLAGPPVDPQAQQIAHQREVTRIKQQQMRRFQQQQQQQQQQQPSAAAPQQQQPPSSAQAQQRPSQQPSS